MTEYDNVDSDQMLHSVALVKLSLADSSIIHY